MILIADPENYLHRTHRSLASAEVSEVIVAPLKRWQLRVGLLK